MVTRINGFSGMDIDSLVKSMMAVKRAPLDKTTQDKELLQWKRDSYREVNSKLYDFRNNKLGLTGYRSSSALNTQTALIKDSAGTLVDGATSAVKATATATANGVPMKVDVAQIATAAALKIDDNNVLGSGFKSSDTLEEIMKKKDSTTKLPENFKFELNLKINGAEQKISFDKGTTLSSAISQINSDPALNVKASFDEVTGQFVFTSKATGEKNAAGTNISVEVGTGTPPASRSPEHSFLKLMSKDGSGNAISSSGQNAIFSINNTVMTDASNTVVYNGVELKFQGVTGKWPSTGTMNLANPPADNKSLNITTTVDTTKALETVKSFVADYNNLIESFNKLVDEEKFKDFRPLTSEQRSAMTESDITAWEKKAKSGMLKNDQILTSALSDMRSAILDKLGPLSSMGITTGNYMENGKLYIDEAKFKAAVEADPQQLLTTLQGTGTNTKDSVFGKFSTAMDNAMDKIAQRAGTSKFDGSLTSTFKSESVMGRELKQYNNRISTMTTQLAATENRYYKQYAAMESAMNKYQSQLAQLTGSAG